MLGPDLKTREENIILKGVPFIAQPVIGKSETGMRDRRNPIIEVALRLTTQVILRGDYTVVRRIRSRN